MSDTRGSGERPAALALTGVSRRFGSVVALHDVSLSLRAGTVHALLGENGAGKTTLMKVAYGMIRPDAGTVAVHGEPRRLASPADAIAAGIGMVHQHFTLVPAMTVADNLALGRRGRYSPSAARERVASVSALTGFALDPDAVVGTLSVGAQQRVEIAKALAHDARILVLDEPTGVLAPAEIEDLLRWLRAYVGRGNAAVLITHKLNEALTVADDVTVLRRGRLAWQGAARGASESSLTVAMIGEAIARTSGPAARGASQHPPVFRAESLAVAGSDGVVRVRDATFDVGAGELIGVAGVEGSGQRELLRALAGRLPAHRGTLARPADVGFVPEDRHHDAVLLERSLTENVALRGAGRAQGRIDWRALRARTEALMTAFDVRAESEALPMSAMSGGNQQKLVVARELETIPMARGAPPESQDRTEDADEHHRSTAHAAEFAPPAIVLENPTRGLDIRATAAVHERLRRAAADGAAVVVYSSDLDEVLALASRVLVVYHGRVRAMPADRDAIGRAMLGAG